MDTDAGVSRLLELIFGKKPSISDTMIAHTSIPSIWLTEDFKMRLTLVFKVKKRIASLRWSYYFDRHCSRMLSSNLRYLTHVIYVCLRQHKCIKNIFDSFISVCALVMYLSEETLEKTEVDFRDLNPEIIMVFYRDVMNNFLEQGGIYVFVEYISVHKYLTWNWDEKNLTLSDVPTFVFLEPELNEKILKEVNSYLPLEEVIVDRATINKTGASLVVKVLTNTSVKFPTLPSESDLTERLVAYRKQENSKKAEVKSRVEVALTNETLHGNSKSILDSKIDYFEEQQEDIAWHENIVQAVIRHNHSDNLGRESADSRIHEESEGILDHLKNGINFLIEVLDECENE